MANLVDGSFCVCSESCFLELCYIKFGDKNLPIRRKVVDGAKPIKSSPGGMVFLSTDYILGILAIKLKASSF